MATKRVIDPFEVLDDRVIFLTRCFLTVAPDWFCLDGFEERFDHGMALFHKWVLGMHIVNSL